VLTSVCHNGATFKYASPELRADKEIILKAVKRTTGILHYVPSDLTADKTLILAVVQLDGKALQYASPELKADREIILAAIASDWRAIQCISPTLKDDQEIILAAIKSAPTLQNVKKHVNKNLFRDKAFLLKAVEIAPNFVKLIDFDFFLLTLEENKAFFQSVASISPSANKIVKGKTGIFVKHPKSSVSSASSKKARPEGSGGGATASISIDMSDDTFTSGYFPEFSPEAFVEDSELLSLLQQDSCNDSDATGAHGSDSAYSSSSSSSSSSSASASASATSVGYGARAQALDVILNDSWHPIILIDNANFDIFMEQTRASRLRERRYYLFDSRVPQENIETAIESLKLGVFILDPFSPAETVKAMIDAVKKHGRRLLLPSKIPDNAAENFKSIIKIWLDKLPAQNNHAMLDDDDTATHESKESVNASHQNGSTALEIAIENNQDEAFLLLLRGGAKKEFEGHELLSTLIRKNKLNLVKILFSVAPDMFHTPDSLFKEAVSITGNNQHLIAFLSKHFPPRINAILASQATYTRPAIQHMLLDRDITDAEIDQIPEYIKTIDYIKAVSSGCKQRLSAKRGDITLNYAEIQMYIDPKYLGGRLPGIQDEQMQPQALLTTPNEKGIWEAPTTTKTSVKFKKLMSLKSTPTQPEIEPLSATFFTSPTHRERYQYLEQFIPGTDNLSKPLTPDTKVMFVFAGRKDNAFLPPVTGNDRCIIVLTLDEYNALQIDKNSPLRKTYDFLLLQPRQKVDGLSTRDVLIGKLIERRGIAFDFARAAELDQIMFLDDNVAEVQFENSLGAGQTSLFDFMAEKMRQTNEIMLSVPTYSSIHNNPKKNQLGCKIFLIDFKAINAAFPSMCLDALMPHDESACSEDYRLQIIVHVFFGDAHRHGYQVLHPSEIQLRRSAGQKSTNAKSGMRLKAYPAGETALAPDVKQILAQYTPAVFEKLMRAEAIFNEKIISEIEQYKTREERIKQLNLDTLRVSNRALSSSSRFNLTGNFRINLIDILAHAFSDNAVFPFTYTSSQTQSQTEHQVNFRPYQNQAGYFLYDNLTDSPENEFVFELATGAGKTILILFFALAAYTADKNKNTILVFPSIDLVHQTLADLFGKFEPLLDYFNVGKDEIYGVCSRKGDFDRHAVQTAPFLNANEPIQSNGHLFLFCNPSLGLISQNENILENTSTVIVDESHKQKNIHEKGYFKDYSPLFLNFSATPTIKNDTLDNVFNYPRHQAIQDKYLTPLITDQTLP
jgi:hypothetical protein